MISAPTKSSYKITYATPVCLNWILCLRNRSADHDIVRSYFFCVCRCHNPLLIVVIAICKADARGDGQELFAQSLMNESRLMGRANNAVLASVTGVFGIA